MLGENKNLKDTSKDSLKDSERKSLMTSYGAGTSDMSFTLAYTKTSKLITALYMVTDTMEKEEPLRLKLRTLGVDILSDITMSRGIFDIQKIEQILSFLNIAFDVRMVSEMNCNILRKEFAELKQSIQEFTTKNNLWFEEFTKDSPSPKVVSFNKGHATRIGVQKGSTLMDALNKIGHAESFQILKDKRREEIIAIIKACPSSGVDKKNNSGTEGLPANLRAGASITDIKNGAKETLVSCGEKTLQRELISMVKDNVLKKTGAKRWSQYFLN